MWDYIIGITIIVAFILQVWARTSRQTIPELIRDIKDIILEQKEDGLEGLAYYE